MMMNAGPDDRDPGSLPDVRQKALHRLQDQSAEEPDLEGVDVRELVHELRVHQIELEMQNEELRRAQVELETAYDRFRDLYEFAPVGYLTVDARNVVRQANLAAARLWDLDRGQILGRRLEGLVVPEHRDRCYLHLRDAATGDAALACKLCLQRGDGLPVWVQMESVPTDDVQGSHTGCRITLTDVSALTRAQEQLAAAASQLTLMEQRVRMRLAHVLHDGLQQLLVGARLRLTAAARNGGSAQDAATEIESLLGEAIEVARTLTAELVPPILREGGLGPALAWLVRWMQKEYNLDVNLVVPVPFEVRPGDDVAVVIFEAVRELLINVARHGDVGAARVQVDEPPGNLRIVVSDKGAGFDPEPLSGQVNGHSGFGLFNIRHRLELLGGVFEVDSAPGRGSRVTLTVPVETASPPVARAGSSPSALAASVARRTRSAKGRVRIVLADDHVVMRQGLSSLLMEEADLIIVGEASDGETAVRLARELRPDVILMDVSMPGLGGVEATRLIHQELPDVQVIGLSMFEDSERGEAMRSAGAAAYLSKSGPTDQLLTTIRSCLAPSRRTGGEAG